MKRGIGHLSNAKIPQMADASRGFSLYNEFRVLLLVEGARTA
jgi:hypothetical protein